MSTISYTTNPLTGRTIRVGGPTFNQLVMEAYDYLDGRLVRRANAPPPRERESYLNIETGRMVQYGTRTYFSLIHNADYEIIEDYYLVPSRLATIADHNPDILRIQDTQIRMERLNHELNMLERPPVFFGEILERADMHSEQWRQAFNRLIENIPNLALRADQPRTRESQLAKLADLNLALCQECQMPVKLDELPENGLCNECSE